MWRRLPFARAGDLPNDVNHPRALRQTGRVPGDVDYRNTARRPPWSALPEAVRAEVAGLTGSPVVTAARPVSSGFTGAYAGTVRCADGSRVFVKAGGPDQPFVVAALAQEARVLRLLPHGIPAPAVVGAGSVSGWSVLVLEVIKGRMPGQPWTADDIDSVHAACVALAERATPVPEGLGGASVGQSMSRDGAILAAGQALDAGHFELPDGMPAWVLDRKEALGRLVLGAGDRIRGDTLSHGDIRPDNLLIDRCGRALVLDWNWVGAGPAWADFVGLLPMMGWQGHDVARLVAQSPLTREADPDAVDGFVACVAVFMMDSFRKEPPPGCTPALRRHQALMARMFLEFLRSRRGWNR